MAYQDSPQPRLAFFMRIMAAFLLLCLTIVSGGLVYLLQGLSKTFDAQLTREISPTTKEMPASLAFPIGVNPAKESIVEQPNVEAFLETQFANDYERTTRITWLDALYEKVAYMPWYQSLASPNIRILVVFAGERKEEVAHNFGRILGWDRAKREEFLAYMNTVPLEIADGTLYPGKYIVTLEATPEQVAQQLQQAFISNVLSRYPEELQEVVPIKDALIVASLIERETASFDEMRIISAVIWNRLFTDMKLQIDATLQYARGSQNWEPKWWPVPVPSDKYIASKHNTYLHKGLPPSPIANPSAAAIIAALNPVTTDCLFYFHENKEMKCSSTYEEHVSSLKAIFGRGK